MGIAEDIRELAASVPQRKRYVRTEEATKNAFVMPFISALGYDIHDPLEVIPEFTADAGVRQQEKVDYAIMKDGRPSILVECKSANVSLGKEHLSQLLRYYAVTDARFGILTNGVEYQFFTDLRKRNVMDEEPFLVVDLRKLDDKAVGEVARFARSEFDAQAIWDLVHTREIEQRDLQTITDNMTREFANPSRDLVKVLAKGVLGKGVQPRVERERVTNLVKRALDQYAIERAATVSDPEKSCSPLKTKEEARKAPQSAEEPDYSKYQYWEQLKANPELLDLFEKLRGYVGSLGREVQINPTKFYISFRRRRAAIYFKFRPGKSLMYLFVNADLERIALQEGFTRRLLESMHYPPCNVEITVHNQEEFERAKPLIRRSYEETI